MSNASIKNSNNIFQSFGDYSNLSANLSVGSTLGNLFQSITQEYALSTSTLAIPVVANIPFELTYTISNETASRFGTATFAPRDPGTSIVYTDQYTETAVSANANISANNDSLLFSLSSGTATLKFNFKTFN